MVDEIKMQLSTRCPCGGTMSIGRTIPPGETEPMPCVIHSIPHCDAFEQKDPVDYVTYVRQSLQN